MERSDSEELKAQLSYLNELLDAYGGFVGNIGKNGLAASLILSYRDEIAESMNYLEEEQIPEEFLSKLNILDEELRQRAAEFIAEAGRDAIRQGREAVAAPKDAWWWYLDSGVKEIKAPRNIWKEFKKWLKS